MRAWPEETDPAFKRVVVRAIGALKGADIDGLLAQWLPGPRRLSARLHRVRPLAERALRKPSSPPIIKLIADPNLGVRIRAIEALGAWKSRAALPSLLKALRADEPTLRWKAVLALGISATPRRPDALSYVAAHDLQA